MLKGRGRDPRVAPHPAPAHLTVRAPTQARQPAHSPTHLSIRTPTLPRAPLAKPEPDYEVVEFPTDQYVNAKLQPPPPPPPRPPTGHPAEAASCGLCGGGGARVRCTECGRRALCASCDDMYHRHPKRRHHQRQALSLNQMRDERPPLPPKGTPPVPPPRRHKMSGDRMSASPRPPSAADQRNSSLASHPTMHTQTMPNSRMGQNVQQIPAHLQKLTQAVPGGHLSSMPYLPTSAHHAAMAPTQVNTMGHMSSGWQRPRNSLPGFNMPPNVQMAPEAWEAPENMVSQSWGRPLRRGASVLELGMSGVGVGVGAGAACAGCGQCAGGWRYGSCASLDHQAWPAPAWPPPPCCHAPHPHAHAHPAAHVHAPYTPQPYRRADSRAASRVASRAGSRAASPAVSVRSRASRRTKHRTPSPPPLPSSDADSESESESDHPPPKEKPPSLPLANTNKPKVTEEWEDPPPAPAPAPARGPWQCEHCTFVNEAGVRVCAVCCRTPTAAPRELPADHAPDVGADRPSVAESVRSVAESARGIERLDLSDAASPPPPAQPQPRPRQNGETTKATTKKERVSTSCGPSPPREESVRKQNNRLVTPTREQSVESTRTRHDMAVGASPPREVQNRTSVARSPPRQTLARASPYREPEKPTRHSISVGPSPPRESSIRPSTVQKKSAGTSPPREREIESRSSSSMIRTNVSNTGTSPPPQSISTQTYEVPNTWERAPSAARGRARRRLRDDSRRERSHSRHSLSSDTRESERSARTSGGGGGRWEWREGRDSSPGGEWSGSERRPPPRLARRASHLDLRRERQPPARRSSFYRSEAASPEPTRAMSLEALATATGANAAAATRGLELARLMAEAERLGFSAAEVQAALAQSPAAPLSWLRSRWPSLCAGVRAAAARLAPHARVSELEARAALARHRGAMWPAVTDCVERHRRQTEKESGTRQHGGRVWGSPAGADDDAAPPRGLREDSSDEFEAPPPADLRDDDWMYLPLDGPGSRRESVPVDDWDERPADLGYREVASDVALELSRLLVQAGVPATNDDLILNSLLSNAPMFPTEELGNVGSKPNSIDFIQSENDFIDAYNALTRSTPLPVVDDQLKGTQALSDKDPKRDMYDVSENYSHLNIEIATANATNNKLIIHTPELVMDSTNKQTNVSQDNQLKVRSITNSPPKQEEALISSTKGKSMPAKEEITNVTKQHSNTEIIPKEDNLTRNNIHQPLIDNFEESLPNESTISAQVEQNLNQIVENIPETEQNVNQAGFEKTNLNDIVGNTQKLIQQMRDEINSDINYIDSKNASQSELESSSNESDISSEHESSYSDTEDKETDELSSNESESSDTDSEKEHSNKRRPTIIHRTSSEENDQFEEAMDHIEDQIEDFKNTNIEILDSIARSLQEEHSISVQVNEPRSIINDKRQDLNNNMFVEVNSFEEIYAQLNTNKNEISNQERLTNHNSTIGSPNKTDMNVTRQQGTVATFNSNSQIQETISKDSHNILYNTNVNRQRDPVHSSEQNVPEEMETNSSKNSANAQNNLDTKDVVSNSSDVEDSLDSADSDITTTEQDNPLNNITASLTESINIQHIEENSAIEDSTSEYIIIEDTIERSTILESTEENMAADNITQIILTDERFDHNIATEDNTEQKIIKVSRSQADLTEETVAMETIQNILIENSNEHDNTIQNIVEERNLSEERAPERTTTEIDIDQTATANNITEQIDRNNSNEQKVLTEDIVEQNIVTENTTDQRTVADNNQERIDINNTNTTAIHLKENEAVINATEERKRSPTKSPPNSPTDAGTNKAFTINKSNIPKLVKVVQNNKQKGDKTSPKVIASKVPVRRASLKQYPAPTPPKTHFGNVQSGHVKQLQTRLFNNKFPKTVVNVPDVIDVKPSTSTIHKKKPAPPPPTTSAAQKQPVLEKPSPPKEKKNSFFRESCRTEDEWTESETEDAPLPAPRESEEPQRPLSPPPPVTLRRVSGQIIDLARVRLPEGSPERQARMLLAEGATETWEQARLAVELVSRGAEPPAALLAALECADLPAALAYLHQDCELCASRLPEHEMVSMLRCTHRCCRECARLYFTVQITERSIADCVCPYCKEPDLENTPEDAWLEYFAHLDILLKTLLETDVHELFQRKLRDRTLALDPNFRWCMECSSGFFVHPKQKKIRCPECRSVSCAKCRKTWSANHEGLSCEQYAAWLDDNDPERSLAAVQQHLRDNGLECPRCRFKYSLSRGGCMHFTCTQCKYEFCYGCGKPFMMGARCGLSEYCARLGLHAHHPRNCLFYLRDKEPHELQTLLQMNNVEYETATPEGSGNRCPIQLQRETPTGLVDGTCGSEAPPNYAGLCKNHYLEYLSRAVRREGVDPLPLLDVDDLETLVKRAALRPPPRPYGTLEGLYKRALLTIVKEKIPLD